MKTKKLFTLLSFLTLALGAFSFALIKNNERSDFKVVSAIDIDDYSACESAHNSHDASGLLSALRTITSPGQAGSYNDLWETYKKAYVRADGYIFDYYSSITNYRPGTDQAGSYSKEGDKYNREHSIPKSWWGGGTTAGTQGADPFIVVPTDGFVNGGRSNFPFGMVGTIDKSYSNSKKGSGRSDFNYSGTVFEPDDSVKGDFARIVYYAIAKYEGSYNWIQGEGNVCFTGNSSTDFGLTPYSIKLFSYWSELDPVSDWERSVNDKVAPIQKNRNPFIDHPEYANTLWGDCANYTPYTHSVPSVGVSISPSSASITEGNTVSLTATSSDSSPITWSTSNSAVATVNQSGVVTGVKAGTATITATSSTVGSATATITVTEPVILSSISVSGQKTSYVVGDSFVKPTVTATYSDSSSKDVTNSATFSNYDLNTEGNYTVNVSYKEGTITKTTSYDITVAPQGQVVVEASVKNDRTFYVGEYITNSDIDVYVDDVKTTSFLFNGSNNYSYQFTYEDAASGGAITNKLFENAISAGGGVCSLTAKVKRKEHGSSESVTDVMTANDLTATGTSYTPFSNVSLTSSARYAGNSAKNTAGNIQLNTKKSDSGIVSTTSGGNLTSVRIVVGSGSNTVQIYGKNTAYSSASDLYDSTKQGTQIGSCSSTSTINITGEYAYVGIRSASGALYLSSVEFTYGSEDTAENVANYIMFEDTIGQCNTKTTVAKGYFEQLSKEERTSFMESSEYVISKGRERLLAWLKNQGMEIESSNNDYVINSNSAFKPNTVNQENNSVIIMISISASISLILVGTLLIKRKKHRQ